MAPDSAHQETGAEYPTARAEVQVEVTPAQADAARLIIEIDNAAGRQTSGLIHKIASARPSRRRSAARPPVAPSPEEEPPTPAADLLIALTPTLDKPPPRSLRRWARRSGRA